MNDELTALLQAADSELDQTLRYEKVTTVGQFVMDQQPLDLPRLRSPLLTGVRNELQNWVINRIPASCTGTPTSAGDACVDGQGRMSLCRSA